VARQVSAILPEAYRCGPPEAAAEMMRACYRELGLGFADVIFGWAPRS
jgi:hypothetical protein